MITTNKKFKYRAGKVAHKQTQSGNDYVEFILGDSKKNEKTGNYEKIGPIYSCRCYKSLPNFQDGSYYIINEIKIIDHYVGRDGKVYTNLVLDIDLADNNNQTQQVQQSNNDGFSMNLDQQFNGFGIGENDIEF